MQTKNLRKVEIKADVDNRTIVGYAAAFGNVDKAREIIEPGAFAKTLQDGMGRLKTFYNHSQPIGKPQVAREDDYGLYTESKISKTAKGDEILELVRDGVIGEMSIMYDVVKYEDDADRRIRKLKELRLYEFGPVDFACNEQAVIAGVKSLAEVMREGYKHGTNGVDAVRDAIKTLEQIVQAAESGEPPKGTPDNQPSIDTGLIESIGELSEYLAEAIRTQGV